MPIAAMRILLTGATLSGLYLLLVGQASTDELVAAVLTGAAGTALSAAVRAGSRHTFRLPPRVWLPPVARALAAVPKDIVLVGWHLVRPRPGTGVLERQAIRPMGYDPASEQAAQVLAASFAPNRYVVDLIQGNTLLIHRLAVQRQ